MASMSCVMSEDQFWCSICLEVFRDPVTTPCGHSFCKTCIKEHWDQSVQYKCPICIERFRLRPRLRINVFISEMVTQFKKKPPTESLERAEVQTVEPGDVNCDICSEAKALKSCLVCLASYCQTHLENHLTIPRLKRHQLIEPMENLDDRLCAKHDKSLKFFCRDDSKFICLQCTFSDHKDHNTVPLKEEGEGQQAKVKQMIDERRLKIEAIQKSVQNSRKNAQQEIEKEIEVSNSLINCVKKSQYHLTADIEKKQQDREKQSTEWIQQLETEILDLEKRRSEMEEVWSSEDHFHFLQTFISDKPAPDVQDWTTVTVRTPSYEGTVAKAVAELRDTAFDEEVKEALKDELRRVQQFAVEVTLDPDTAHPNVILSSDYKEVYRSDRKRAVPDNPKRFSSSFYVVGKQTFSFGRKYFEVQVQYKTSWFIGVAKKSIKRKEQQILKPENGYWIIGLNNNEYRFHGDSLFPLHLKTSPKKIGVFVDYEERIVSFYDVDTAELIHSFTDCSFTEDLVPLFNPGANKNGLNSAPLVIIPPV